MDGGLLFTITCTSHSYASQNNEGLKIDAGWEEGLDVDWDEVDALEKKEQ